MVVKMLACNPLHKLYNTVESCPVFHECTFEQLYACASSTSISRHMVVRIWNADIKQEAENHSKILCKWE